MEGWLGQGRHDLSSCFSKEKNKKQQPSVSLYALASLEGHTCPRALLGARQTLVLSPSPPQLRFWGALMLTQHGQAGKGPRKPLMSHSICARKATSHDVGTGSGWGPHPGASAPQEAQSSWSIDPTTELGPPCKPKLKGLGSMGVWEAEGAGGCFLPQEEADEGLHAQEGGDGGAPSTQGRAGCKCSLGK